MDRVLVLLATYNGEKYLYEQLKSVYNQTGVEVSVLVRDDGSLDNTTDILELFKENNGLEWYRGDHLGIQGSYFELMEKASNTRFDFFAFCDQDDIWDEDKLSLAISEIKKQTGPALYYCGQRLVDVNLNVLSIHELNTKRSLLTRFVLSDFAGCTGAFNRKLIEQVVVFKPDYMIMHDTWILKVCMCLGGSVIVDPKPHMSYRQHNNNAVGLRKTILSDFLRAYKYIFAYNVEKQMHELHRGYGNKMVLPYREVCEWICGYKNSVRYKKKLLDKKNIDFCRTGLNVVLGIKVIFNRL